MSEAPAAPLDGSDEASPNVGVEHTLLGGFVAVFFERMKWGQTHQTAGRRFVPWQFVTKALIEPRVCVWQRSVAVKVLTSSVFPAASPGEDGGRRRCQVSSALRASPGAVP